RSGAFTISIDFHRNTGTQYWQYGFTSPAIGRPPLEPLSDWQARREGTPYFSIDMDAGSRAWQAAKDRLPPLDLARAARLAGENLLLLFFSPSWPDPHLE